MDIRALQMVNRSDLAEAVGISRVAISYILNGHSRPAAETARKIAKYFAVSTDDLLETLEHMKPGEAAGSRTSRRASTVRKPRQDMVQPRPTRKVPEPEPEYDGERPIGIGNKMLEPVRLF